MRNFPYLLSSSLPKGSKIGVLLFLFIAVLTALPVTASDEWTIEAVDAPSMFFNSYNRATAIDKITDQPHIVYGGDRLFHAFFDGTQWQYETVDNSSSIEQDASIAIDSNNSIHISYYDSTNKILKYATNASGAWVVLTIDAAGDARSLSSIAVDSEDKVHISYYDSSNSSLKYATNASGLWVIYTIDSLGDVGLNPSIAIDSNNNVHISYYDVTNGDLKYATNASGSWVTSTIDSSGDSGRYNSIALDSYNYVHISYYDNTNKDLKYATNASYDTDDDGDGYTENQGDCNDSDPDVHPGAAEICDAIDNDCDGQTDEGSICGPVDLIVSVLTAPAKAGEGQTITVKDTTINNGTGMAGESATKIYWSADKKYDAEDIELGSRTVPALAGGATSTGDISVTIPSGTCSGTYYLIAMADADGAVSETSETNNNTGKSIKIKPDLIVSGIKASASAPQGATITVTTTTKNKGVCAAEASTTRLYLSTNSTYDSGDTELGSSAVPALAAGAADKGSTSVTIPEGTTAGAYYIITISDADAVVSETSEANNDNYKPITITP
ncbi:MAG: hypothetical protein C4560_06135 [Nitrospiraceae bacterium]|nr:MAG: hypothetical protein C4560_06135 [Nitrospiraceae bacterium]